MTVIMNGFAVGESVEAKHEGDHEWLSATLVELDSNDARYPYRVCFANQDPSEWVRAADVRKLNTGVRYEYRRTGGAVESPWSHLELTSEGVTTISVPANTRATRIEIHQVPARTEAEIIVKLRELVRSHPGALNSAGQKLLKGEF